MSINWDEVQQNAGGDFKNYYADGDYKAKCDGVEIKEVGQNGSIIMKFHFEETNEGQFPTADHWLSFKNDSWRQWHNKCLMEVLGATEDNAKKAVEMCESKNGKENISKAYETTYKKLLAKKPEVDINVYTEVNPNDGKEYARAEFKDRKVAMPHGDEASKKDVSDSPIDGATDVSGEIAMEDLPF